MDEFSVQADQYLEDNYPDFDILDFMETRKIKKEYLGLLPNSLPFETNSTSAEWIEVPASLRDTITFSGGGLHYTVSLPEIAGKSITLGYAAATDEDRALISDSGDISEIPAYLLDTIPVLRLDGTGTATGSVVSLGQDHNFTMEIKTAAHGPDVIDNILVAGSYYAVTLNLGRIPKPSIDKHAKRGESALEAIQSLETTTAEDIKIDGDAAVGGILQSAGLLYFAELDAAYSLISTLSGVPFTRDISEAMTGYNMKTENVLGITTNVSPQGVFMDVDRDSLFAFEEPSDKLRAFSMQTGMMSSTLEGEIWNQLFPEQTTTTVSTAVILRRAAEEEIPIYNLTSDNIDVIADIELTSSERADFRNMVAQGYTITVPAERMTFGSWRGTGYIVSDPDTGASGYMISGGLGGSIAMISTALRGLLSGALFIDVVQPFINTPWVRASVFFAPWAALGITVFKAVRNIYASEKLSIAEKEKLKNQVYALAVGAAIAIGLLQWFGGAAGIAGGFFLGTVVMPLIFGLMVPAMILRAESANKQGA